MLDAGPMHDVEVFILNELVTYELYFASLLLLMTMMMKLLLLLLLVVVVVSGGAFGAFFGAFCANGWCCYCYFFVC